MPRNCAREAVKGVARGLSEHLNRRATKDVMASLLMQTLGGARLRTTGLRARPSRGPHFSYVMAPRVLCIDFAVDSALAPGQGSDEEMLVAHNQHLQCDLWRNAPLQGPAIPPSRWQICQSWPGTICSREKECLSHFKFVVDVHCIFTRACSKTMLALFSHFSRDRPSALEVDRALRAPRKPVCANKGYRASVRRWNAAGDERNGAGAPSPVEVA